MSIIGGYEMHLYCDEGGDAFGAHCPNRGFASPQGEYNGSNERDCLKQARKDGWTFKEQLTVAYCPKCSKGLRP